MDLAVVFWLVIGAIVIAGTYFRNAAQVSRNEVIKTLLEKGHPLPPELFKEGRPWDHRNFVAGGILLCGLGVAAAVFFWALTSGLFGGPDNEHAKFLPFVSACPVCLGIACFLVGRYLKSHD